LLKKFAKSYCLIKLCSIEEKTFYLTVSSLSVSPTLIIFCNIYNIWLAAIILPFLAHKKKAASTDAFLIGPFPHYK